MLKDIGEKDFWPEALAHFNFTPSVYEYCTSDMPPELKKQVDADIGKKAMSLKISSVVRYAMTDEGQEEIEQLHSGLLAKIDQILLHRDAVVISQKLGREASDEIMTRCGERTNLFVFELFVKNNFTPAQKAQEADGLLGSAVKMIMSSAPDEFAQTLCENPLWFHQIMEMLDKIDGLLLEAMPRRKFPPDETIKDMGRLVFSPDWTPTASTMAVLQSLATPCN